MSNFKLLVSTLGGHDLQEVSFTTFSDGCEVCRIDPVQKSGVTGVRVIAYIEDGNRDIVRLGLVKSALDSVQLGCEVSLTMDYVPNARADRLFQKGESFSLQVTCSIINSYKYTSVVITDPHSDVTPALLNNVEVVPQTKVFSSIKHLIPFEDYILVSPDLGAAKKTFDIASQLGHKDYVQGLKIRDINTGDIIKCGISYDGDLTDKDVVIVDDICDGGASFLYLAKKLKELGVRRVVLCITHGIFSKGLTPLQGMVDYIICPNLIERYINKRDIELFNIK